MRKNKIAKFVIISILIVFWGFILNTNCFANNMNIEFKETSSEKKWDEILEESKSKEDEISNVVSNSISISDSTSSDLILNLDENKRVEHNTIIMANELLRNNLKGTDKYSSSSKYPNAGLESNIFVPIIKVLIGMLVISLVVMSTKVRKNEKD